MPKTNGPKLVRTGSVGVYQTNYRDPAGNQWRINLTAPARAAHDLQATGALRCSAEALSPDVSIADWIAKVKKAYKTFHKTSQPLGFVNPDIATRKLKLSLREKKVAGAYRVKLYVDPIIVKVGNLSGAAPFDSCSFYVPDPSAGYITVSAQLGSLIASVDGWGSIVVAEGTSGSIPIFSSAARPWQVSLVLQSGQPTYVVEEEVYGIPGFSG